MNSETHSHALASVATLGKTAKIYWEIENIDKRIGEMIGQLEKWGIADNTLFIFIASDNGASGGQEIHNAGMKGHKGQPYQGGTRVPAFFRWPDGGIEGGSESAALTSQMDIMPTLLEIAGAPLTDQIKQQVEGRSLVPLLKNPAIDWEGDRHLVHHVGGWEPRQAAQSKHAGVSIQNKRFTLVNNEELYDLSTDPGETENVIAEHPEVADQLRTVYDQWWTRMGALLSRRARRESSMEIVAKRLSCEICVLRTLSAFAEKGRASAIEKADR